MQVGFKTGPKTWAEGKRIVEQDSPRLCEVWFRIDKVSEYDEMLSWLQKHDVQIGLHHWGLVAGRYKTNLATSNEDIRQETIQQIKDTIDVSTQIDGAYVNAHPGAALVEEIDLEHGTQRPVVEETTDLEESGALFLSAARELEMYASERKVLLTLETIPAREMYQFHDRRRSYDPQPVPLAVMRKLGAQQNWLANDITHTLATICTWESNELRRWDDCMKFTRQAQLFTRLLHVNTLMPPYNGTDSHDGITPADFAKGVVPRREQIQDILKLFKDRDDVFIIPEPKDMMQDNYRALQALVQSI